jgi:choice-of-anchor C domain-containing protein
MRTKSGIGLAFLVLITVSTHTARAGNLILNGSFESPVVTDPSGAIDLLAGDPSLAPWVIFSGSVDVVNNSRWPAYTGTQSLDLNGVSPGMIGQDFVTTPGVEYRLDFAYANNPENPSLAGATAFVVVTGSGITPLLFQEVGHSGSTVPNMNYASFEGFFTANSAATTLIFESATGADNQVYGVVLDNVSVNPVPELDPGSMAGALTLLVGGMLRLSGRRRR